MDTNFGIRSTILRAAAGLLIAAIVLVAAGPAAQAGTTVTVGSNPVSVAVDQSINRIYVSNNRDDTVSVIDGSRDVVIKTIAVGTHPQGIGLNPSTNKIYVANESSNSVSVIDGTSGTVKGSITVGTSPLSVCVNAESNRIYVANSVGKSITVINGTTDSVIRNVPVSLPPRGVGVNPTTNKIYVVSSDDRSTNMVTLIDGTTDHVIRTLTIGEPRGYLPGPWGVGVDPVTNKIYVANHGIANGSVAGICVINGSNDTVAATLTCLGPAGIDVNVQAHRVYVACVYGGVAVIDETTDSILNSLDGGAGPEDVGLNTATNKLYVSNRNTTTVTVVALSEVASTYFAEGYTGPNFQEYLCLGNPDAAAVTAKVTYMFTDGTSKEASYTVPATSRTTVNVNSEVGPDKELSVRVASDSPDLVAERPMYFNYQGKWTGGHDNIGGLPSQTWYFAEGTTRPGFDEWITVLNPGNVAAALTFQYMVEGHGEQDVTGKVGAHCRATFNTRAQIGSGKDASLLLQSSQSIVAERPMYFDYQGMTLHNWTGGHCTGGTTSPSSTAFFAEGTTRPGFEEWLTIQNPHDTGIKVKANYLLGAGQGASIAASYDIPPKQRLTVSVNQAVGAGKDVSTGLASDATFVAERPMYFNYAGTRSYTWDGGHDVVGKGAGYGSFMFAEGYTGANFEEWICIANVGEWPPSDNGIPAWDAHVKITYYIENGKPVEKEYVVPPGTRYTIFVNQEVGPDKAVSARVTNPPIMSNAIVVERPIYFNYQGAWTGGSDI